MPKNLTLNKTFMKSKLVSEIKKGYPEVIAEVKKDSSRLLGFAPSQPKIYLCGRISDIEGKYVVFKLQLGNTKDFAILSTKTPFSMAVNLSYSAKKNILRLYGGKAYMKPLWILDNESDAREVATELRDLMEASCEPNFKRLSW